MNILSILDLERSSQSSTHFIVDDVDMCDTADTNPIGKKRNDVGAPRKIPHTYKLPNRFRQDVQLLLSDKQSIMVPKDTAAILREVATSIQVYTYTPTKADYSFVVRQLVDLYPQLSVLKDTEGKVVSQSSLCFKLLNNNHLLILSILESVDLEVAKTYEQKARSGVKKKR